MSAEWQYTYSDVDNAKGAKKRQRPEKEEKETKLGYDEAASMNPRQRKLHELREKFKQSRNENRKAVEEEEKQAVEGTDAQETKRRRLEYYEKLEADRLAAEESGVGDVKKQQLLNVTAEEAERKSKSKSKKKARQEATFGWESKLFCALCKHYSYCFVLEFGSDAEYNAYKNRQKDMTFSKEEYEKQKQSDPSFFREAHDLDYGQNSTVSKEKVTGMVKELDKL